MKKLAEKVAVVTGGSQGIGRAVALRLARDGARVVVGYRTHEAAAREVVSQIEAAGGEAVAAAVDIAQPASTAEFFQSCLRAFGRPDILVSDAGVATLQPLAEVEEAEYDRVFDVNSKGTLFCLKEAGVHLNDHGRVVQISSSTTAFPTEGAYIYAASKNTIKMYTEVAAQELGKRGITVNTVLPGVTETPMTARLPDDFKRPVAESSPFKRLGRPEDIADVVAFLASDDARWITGQHLLVNGGAKQ